MNKQKNLSLNVLSFQRKNRTTSDLELFKNRLFANDKKKNGF